MICDSIKDSDFVLYRRPMVDGSTKDSAGWIEKRYLEGKSLTYFLEFEKVKNKFN